MKEVVIVAAKRTALGSFLGSLSKIKAPQLGAYVISQLLKDTKVSPQDISEVIMGQVLTAGVGQNPARQAAILAGIPKKVPSLTINQVCGSGLKAVYLAYQSIMCGDAEIVIAGGQENMSLSPHLLHGSREGFRMGDAKLQDSMVYDGLTDVYNDYHMGVTAENVAKRNKITREMQDKFACESQMKASKASKDGIFDAEIVPIEIKPKKGDPIVFKQDEFIRHDISMEALAKLKPAFAKEDGSVTAGNASGINDGAAAVMLMTKDKAKQLGLTPLATIVAGSSTGLDPELMGLGPVSATHAALNKTNWEIKDLDLIEANEAFAAQAVAVSQELGLDSTKVNVNGGAIALGHPIGASGCRILVTLLHQMQRSNAKKGLATLCIGGGMGVALVVERN